MARSTQLLEMSLQLTRQNPPHLLVVAFQLHEIVLPVNVPMQVPRSHSALVVRSKHFAKGRVVVDSVRVVVVGVRNEEVELVLVVLVLVLVLVMVVDEDGWVESALLVEEKPVVVDGGAVPVDVVAVVVDNARVDVVLGHDEPALR